MKFINTSLSCVFVMFYPHVLAKLVGVLELVAAIRDVTGKDLWTIMFIKFVFGRVVLAFEFSTAIITFYKII